jgi:bacillithiol system protein YtxJ
VVGTIIDLSVEALPVDCYVFKHSTRCPISTEAARVVKTHAFELPLYWVNVIEQRELSNWIAATYGVQHESPQLIEIRSGAATRSLSHYAIAAEDL